ncbi:MAG: hypothetical protein LBE51_19195 [Acidovorax sp.]|jgi:hypothetical protein|uniref:hypothetical protein n=1 Tax=Comamonas sp. TaxID=34028 RepID=UPI00281D6BBB|nr:hypothetical protein [Comamonas sp.]MDR0215393.1 hypothetical protein [Comamonas sp.]MDR2327513.1 hypothetical protein [Acidovorax sp.]
MNVLTKSALACLLLPLAALSQAAEPASPVPAADLYLRTLVNHEEKAIADLNSYLRPDRLRSGRSADYADITALKKADQEFPGEVASMALPLFPEAQRKSLKTPLENLMRSVQEARQKSQCKALSAGETETGAHGVLNTQVQFECLLVKTHETWAQGIQRMARAKLGTAKVVAELEALQKAYAGPASYKYEGMFPLSMVPQDKDVAWRNDFAREVVDEMFNEF